MFGREDPPRREAYVPPPLAEVGEGMLGEERSQQDYWEASNKSMTGIIREFTHDPAIAEKFKPFKEFLIFGMVSKHMVLANLTEKDHRIMLRKYFIIRDKFLNSLRMSQLTDEMQMKLDNLELAYRAILTRATGPNRERVLQSSQIRQQVLTRDMEPPQKKAGFFGRIFGFGRKEQVRG